ncbi:hypothetical protein [Cryptosporangium aurantiacum]|uniref:Uncharacterized protein n=1 Tax=Cryptosporangium aurantiacum TaxID=134849 RepID=A0A1M7RDX6_9ACTN|nr:hypothetical protein [Cryptosporangium aurantiacum]SHN44349.1 hypothetical protein SAMN05443668_110172 [Cryptosporangium aurantiacum]
MTRKTVDGWQGLFCFVGVTLGVIPLAQYAFGIRRGGLLRFVLGQDPGAALWIVPLTILGLAITGVLLFERLKPRA